MKRIEEMIYREIKIPPEILLADTYKEHKFAILNLGTHPVAFIEDKIGLSGYDDFRLKEISVHGGFSFYGAGYWNKGSKKISWLGWDYSHPGDFMGYYSTDNPFYYKTKQWTTAEIYKEVKSVIEQIIKVEQYANSDEAKCIQAMLQDCREAYYNYSQAEKTCRTLYQKGYRKQSDTAREILRMIKDKGLLRYGGYLLHDSDFDTVGKLYGVEVEE